MNRKFLGQWDLYCQLLCSEVKKVDDDDDDDEKTHAVHWIIILYLSVPRPLQSQFTLCNHYSTHLPIPLLFIPVSGWLMAVQLLQMFIPAWCGKVRCLYALSELPFGIPNRMLWDTGTELFGTCDIVIVLREVGWMGSPDVVPPLPQI